MKPSPYLIVETAEARELAELILIANDIEHSIHAMELWVKKYSSHKVFPDRETELIGNSLFRASVMQFMSCFHSSGTMHLPWEEIYQADAKGKIFFDWFKGVRDAFLAHRHGAYRQSHVCAITHPEAPHPQYFEFTLTFNGPQGDLRNDLVPLMTRAARYLETRINPLKKRVVADINSMTPEQLAKLKPAAFRMIPPTQARKTRHAVQGTGPHPPKK